VGLDQEDINNRGIDFPGSGYRSRPSAKRLIHPRAIPELRKVGADFLGHILDWMLPLNSLSRLVRGCPRLLHLLSRSRNCSGGGDDGMA